MKHYLIDSENVNDNWLMLLEFVEPDDEIIVFYTKNSPHMSYSSVIKLIQYDRPIKFEECHEGNNGLDFQLVSYLGYLMKTDTDKNSEFIIMSNDTGFDAAVSFWKDRNFPVNRINVNYCKSMLKKQPESTSSTQVEDAIPAEVNTLINCIGLSNLTAIHETLVHIYGQSQGQTIYKTIKDKSYPFSELNLARIDKVNQFSDIIFSHSNLSSPENFVDFLEKNKGRAKNLNGIRSAIVKAYGEGNGMKYYSLFKPYFKIISAFK